MLAALDSAQWQLFEHDSRFAEEEQVKQYSLSMFGMAECRRAIMRLEQQVHSPWLVCCRRLPASHLTRQFRRFRIC